MASITDFVGGYFDLLEHSEAIDNYTEDGDFEHDVEKLQHPDVVNKFFSENLDDIMHFAALYAKVKYKNTVADLVNRKVFKNELPIRDIYGFISGASVKCDDQTVLLHNQFIARRYLITLGLASLCRAVSHMINEE